MITKTPTANMTHAEWLEARRHSVGGSDLGAILGLNKYQSAYSVWANKTGRIPDSEPNEAMRQGTDLEEYGAKRFSEKSGLKVQHCNFIIRNSDFPHLHANIDRKIIGMNAGLECKTASAYNADKFTADKFPESYYAQCVAYMAICGYSTYYLAAVVLGSAFKIYQLTTDPEAVKPEWCESSAFVAPEEFNAISEVVESFWTYVETDTEPQADGSPATTEAINEIYANADESIQDIDLFGLDRHFERINEIKTQIDELKVLQTAEENAVKIALGEAVSGQTERFSCTWKNQTRRTFDSKKFIKDHPEFDVDQYYKTSTSRVFRFKEAK